MLDVTSNPVPPKRYVLFRMLDVTSNPVPPKRYVLFRMLDVTSNPVPPKGCVVSYTRRNFEPGSSETLRCFVC